MKEAMLHHSLITSDITPYFKSSAKVQLDREGIFVGEIPRMSEAMKANSECFGHSFWGPDYLEKSHRGEIFRSRYHAATGSLDHKVVVDIGCGPGNFYATVGGSPKTLIGVDVSYGALQLAKKVGYIPLQADAQNLPLIDNFADLVVATATIHHCDDMEKALSESARLVRPGGLLMTDLDPQITANNFKGLAAFLRKNRFVIYRLMSSPYYLTEEYRKLRTATEAHNKVPGDGIAPETYYQTLEPLGFEVELYPHNMHYVGAEVLNGEMGQLPLRLRILQRMSGIKPDTPEAAQSIMCIARKKVCAKKSTLD